MFIFVKLLNIFEVVPVFSILSISSSFFSSGSLISLCSKFADFSLSYDDFLLLANHKPGWKWLIANGSDKNLFDISGKAKTCESY